MKSRLVGVVFACLIILNTAQATTVFNTPGIETIRWLELTSTANMSRLEVEAELGAGGLFEGWRYATRTETENLYDSLWGGSTEGLSTDNYAGARTFFDTFGISDYYAADNNSGYSSTGYAQWQPYFGAPSECGGSEIFSCNGNVVIQDSTFNGTQNRGSFEDLYGLSTGIDNVNDQNYAGKTSTGLNVASHLVQDVSTVPVPAAVWLFCSGLLGLLRVATGKKQA